jgi:Fur family transcriptional regulator, ferric uptake regulator
MSCQQILREKGYRLTPQRMMVVDVLHSADNHISAEDIFQKVKAAYPYANISTVYRTLELLKKLDLVTEIDTGEGCLRYHHREKGHHHHLVCSKCGKVAELPESLLTNLQKTISRDYGFEPNLNHLAIFGLCSECKVKTEKKK